uniref:Tetratricopeptide SHNi-TPR domain-containing protein n=1 Tax=Palpitomonas bilix TaxID=652834 RepID=A0A7S3D0S6_9EUKA|mmetsp:Transcript_16881/g.42375  ORF Transcript_16881/g.42375 Transcript_16881/m.42375 type:complete len:310 (+) Transcript_16881:38-967(+)|eukprot:CAMPEP_0113887524 /NCGR_PEP_ID=MMETSP0780_2-20120614/12266_1 /TAXON_ID=652834 /ORGANISM="Palpitomonas bilix" /LENGTH=309 /DNA_ID=CAMNT_0000876075 /DNA_START=25 /DNA_END=954 /DNA_ORIENTATION=+ /assembly_acc=CAM_ASM_000599
MEVVRDCLNKVEEAFAKGEFKDVMKLATEGLEAAMSAEGRKEAIDALDGTREAAMAYINKGVQQEGHLDTLLNEAHLFLLRSQSQLNSTKDEEDVAVAVEGAIEDVKQASSLFAYLADDEGAIQSSYWLGIAQTHYGRALHRAKRSEDASDVLQSALEALQESFSAARSLKEGDRSDRINAVIRCAEGEVAFVLLSLAQIGVDEHLRAFMQGEAVDFDELDTVEDDLNTARDLLESELKRSSENETQSRLASCFCSLGTVKMLLGDTDESMKMLTEGKRLFSLVGDANGEKRAEGLMKNVEVIKKTLES